jgi:hypothetical protein
MDALIEIGKNTVKYFLWLVGVLAFLLLLMVPCFIGIAIDCIPLVLLGILFFAAAAVSILKYHIEHNVKDE